jgi:PAS domain S-box-containing protein
MTIKSRLILILLAGFGLYLVLDFAVQRSFILQGLLDLERQEFEKDLRRCTEAIRREIYHLAIFTSDWSSWDDTYAFVQDGNPDYPSANFLLPTFQTNRLNLILVVARDGQVRYARAYDEANKTLIEPAGFPASPWPPAHPLLMHNNANGQRDGILQSAYGPMLLVARPILPTLGVQAGKPMGTILMGRLLDADLVADLREQTHVHFETLPAGQIVDPRERAYLQLTRDGSFLEANTPDKDTLNVYTTLNDLAGEPALLLRSRFSRELLRRGQEAMSLDALSAAIGAAVVFLLVILTVQRTVVRPLQGLVTHVQKIGQQGTLSVLPYPERNDEVGILAREFNRMVVRLHEEDARKAEAEAKLRKSEAHFGALLESAPDPILVVNASGKIEKANRAVENTLGLLPVQLEGLDAAGLFEGEGAQGVTAMLPRNTHDPDAAAGPAAFEVAFRHPAGHLVPIYLTAGVTRLEANPVLLLLLKDLTEYKQTQQSLANHRHLASIGEMSAFLAHDIRNPMAGIRGVAELLRMEFAPESREAELMGEIVRNVERVEGTVRHLLQFAKVYRPECEDFDLRLLFEDLAREAAHAPGCTHITLTYDGPEEIWIHGDPHLLREVLSNLWSNACHAMPQPGEARWIVRQHGNDWHIALEDEGSGVPEAILPHLFEPFFTTRATGTGLGLAICRRILEAQGATIAVANRTPRGAVMTIVFPARGKPACPES